MAQIAGLHRFFRLPDLVSPFHPFTRRDNPVIALIVLFQTVQRHRKSIWRRQGPPIVMRNQDGKSSVEEWLVVAELPCVLETSIRRKEQRCNPTIRFLDLTMEHLRWISAAVDVGIVDEIHIVRTDGLHLIEL